jgi:hypothetical protein
VPEPQHAASTSAPVPPCSPHGHTWAWIGSYGPKRDERCYCGRAKWRSGRA